MKDLSLHLLDLIENAAKAGAGRVVVTLWWEGPAFCLEVSDNGPGLPEAVAAAPTDPYSTTRTERPVGLGLALLQAAADQVGGRVEVRSVPGAGVTVLAVLPQGHVDAKPLGDLVGALVTAAVGWPLDLQVAVGRPAVTILDLAAVREHLDAVPLSHPEVVRYLREVLEEGLAPLQAQADRVFGAAAPTLASAARPPPA